MPAELASSATPAMEARYIGGYRIGAPLAAGGVASVFLGRKSGPGRFAKTAAIKVLHPHLAGDRALVEMFLDEARLAAHVNHPSLCRVLDCGAAEGTFFLAFEYVPGESWHDVLAALIRDPAARRRVPVLAAYVLAQSCEALHALHEARDGEGRSLQVVHRDVAPQNLMVAYDGSVRVLDLGIASAEGRVRESGPRAVRGRYAYMAPEQLQGLELDRRADVWSLGVMLREALSGENPFLRTTQAATILAATSAMLPAWPETAPVALRAIADRCLARDPEARFDDARQLGRALARYLREQRESSLGAELARFTRRSFAGQVDAKRALLRQLARAERRGGAPGGEDDHDRLMAPGTLAHAVPLALRSWRRWALAFVLLGSAVAWFWLARQTAPEVRRSASQHRAHAAAHASPSSSAAGAPTSLGPEVSAPSAPTAPDTAHVGDAGARATAAVRDQAEAVGQLVIGAAEGWAEVFLHAQRLGSTPLRVELPAGAHVLTWRPYGAGSARRVPVMIKRASTTKLRLDPRAPSAPPQALPTRVAGDSSQERTAPRTRNAE